MTTVAQIINGAAEEIGVKTAEINLEPADFQVILNRMNDMLLEWVDSGLVTSYTEVTNSTAVVDIERHAIAAIKYNLAIRCAPAFQKVITPALAALASDTLQRLEASSINIGEVAMPDTLPIGSGNDCVDSFFFNRFFPQNQKENF